jgi:hypothetical protein
VDMNMRCHISPMSRFNSQYDSSRVFHFRKKNM